MVIEHKRPAVGTRKVAMPQAAWCLGCGTATLHRILIDPFESSCKSSSSETPLEHHMLLVPDEFTCREVGKLIDSLLILEATETRCPCGCGSQMWRIVKDGED